MARKKQSREQFSAAATRCRLGFVAAALTPLAASPLRQGGGALFVFLKLSLRAASPLRLLETNLLNFFSLTRHVVAQN